MGVYESLNEVNRRIIDNELQNHERHYRALVSWCKSQIKRPGRFYKMSGPGMLGNILSNGHTVCCCIWEKYGGDDK